MTKIVFLQLMAVRAMCVALIECIDALQRTVESVEPEAPAVPTAPSTPGVCAHPLDTRVPLPTMGARKFKCLVCKEDVTE